MIKLDELPNVNFDLLNAFFSADKKAILRAEFEELLQNVFSVTLENLDIQLLRVSSDVVSHVFYVGHQQCLVDVGLPSDKLLLKCVVQSGANSSSHLKDLIEEHIALQTVRMLKDLFFIREVVVFQGRGSLVASSELDCISLKLSFREEEELLTYRINIYVPPKLELDQELVSDLPIPSELQTLCHPQAGEQNLKVDLFLGVLYLPPSSLVDALIPGNKIDLPFNVSMEEGVVSFNHDIYFSGVLKSHNFGNTFILKEKLENDLFNSKSGYSSVFLRIYSGQLSPKEIGIKFPYFCLESKWHGEVEMLIGGEFVSRGILEYSGSDIILRVC